MEPRIDRTRPAARAAFLVLLASALAVTASPARALTLDYVLAPTQSSVAVAVEVDLFGGALTAAEQFSGSLTTRYDGTMRAATGSGTIGFPSGGAAVARNQVGLFNIPRQLSPAVGGGSGTAPGNYGVTLTAPVGTALPPIEIPDLGTLNLGTLQSVDVDITLRDVVLDAATAAPIPITSGAFDASLVDVLFSGNADLNVAAVLRAPDLATYFINLVALGTLASSFPELGIGVTGNLLTRDISIGIGTRLPFASLAVPNQAGAGSVTRVGDDSVLVLPLFAELAPAVVPGVFDLRLAFHGQLRGVAPVPEPATAALLGLGLAALAGRRRAGRA